MTVSIIQFNSLVDLHFSFQIFFYHYIIPLKNYLFIYLWLFWVFIAA